MADIEERNLAAQFAAEQEAMAQATLSKEQLLLINGRLRAVNAQLLEALETHFMPRAHTAGCQGRWNTIDCSRRCRLTVAAIKLARKPDPHSL